VDVVIRVLRTLAVCVAVRAVQLREATLDSAALRVALGSSEFLADLGVDDDVGDHKETDCDDVLGPEDDGVLLTQVAQECQE